MVSSWENPTCATSNSTCLSSKTSLADLFIVWKKVIILSHLIKHFRESFSTDSCLAKLTDFVLTVVNKGMHTSMILTNSRRCLTQWTKNCSRKGDMCLNFKTPVIKWFESDLLNKKFYISVDDVFSEARILNCDVPEESILGQLLFLIYINDLLLIIIRGWLYLYADTCISTKMKTFVKLKIFQIKNSQHSANGYLITSHQFIWGQ